MTSQLIVRINDELKKKVSRFAMTEGKNTSQVVREMLEAYVNDRDINAHIDQLWERIGKKLATEGIGPEDVQQAISEVRANR